MTEATNTAGAAAPKAYIVTGPTSGIGLRAALKLARHGTVILAGRDAGKLEEVRQAIGSAAGHAVSVVCDLSDMVSVRRAAAQIAAMQLPVAGLLHNAGINAMRPAKSAQGWDLAFATNHLGPFALTEALAPHLADGTHVLFVASAIEDPDRAPVKAAGLRGGRYISAQASARGEWQPGGASRPGMDSYATSKQCILAAALAFARENPRLRFNAIEPGITPGTRLGREAPLLLRLLFSTVITRLPPYARYRSTPERAGRVIAKVLMDESAGTGVYYDERGRPMQPSNRVQDPGFQDLVAAETRALLATVATVAAAAAPAQAAATTG